MEYQIQIPVDGLKDAVRKIVKESMGVSVKDSQIEFVISNVTTAELDQGIKPELEGIVIRMKSRRKRNTTDPEQTD